MALDPVTNLVKCEVSQGYDDSATSIELASGDGAQLPDPSADGEFNLTYWNATDYPDPTDDPNVEIVRVTARSTDTLTVTRAQEGTSASTKNEAGKTYLMVLGITKKTRDDIDDHIEDGDKHREIDDGGTGATDLWSADKIGTELSGKSDTSHTHTESDITDLGDYIESVSEDTSPQLGGNLDADDNDFQNVGDLDYTTASNATTNAGNLGSSHTFDFDTGSFFRGTLDDDTSITVSNLSDGQRGQIVLYYDGSSQRSPSYSGIDVWLGGEEPDAPDTTDEPLVVTVINDGNLVIASGGIAS